MLRFAADRILAPRTGPSRRTLSVSEGVWIKRRVVTFRHNNKIIQGSYKRTAQVGEMN
jgi:hypothetical protein